MFLLLWNQHIRVFLLVFFESVLFSKVSGKLCKKSLDEVNAVKQRSCPLWLDPAFSVLINVELEWMWMLKYKKKSWVTSNPDNIMLIILHKSAWETLACSVLSIGIICYSIGKKMLAKLDLSFAQEWIHWLNTVGSGCAWTELEMLFITLRSLLLKQSASFKMQAVGCFTKWLCLIQN